MYEKLAQKTFTKITYVVDFKKQNIYVIKNVKSSVKQFFILLGFGFVRCKNANRINCRINRGCS